MSPSESEKWVPLGVWSGKAPISVPEVELDLFKLACHKRRARISWVLRAFILRTILTEFRQELQPEWVEHFERGFNELLDQRVHETTARKGALRLHARIDQSIRRVRDLFKGGTVNVG